MIRRNHITGGNEWVSPNLNGDNGLGGFLRAILCFFGMLLLMYLISGCTTTRKVSERDAYITSMHSMFDSERTDYQHRIDSLRSLVMQRDSTVRHYQQRDSTWQNVTASDTLMAKDSIHVSTDADGRTLEQHYHWEYRIVYRDRLKGYIRESTDITEQYSYLTSQLLEMTLLQTESHDSIVWLQDSLRNILHTQEKVVVRSNPVVEFLAAIGIVAVVFLFTWLLLRLRVLF